MNDDLGVGRAVIIRRRALPQIHLHATASTIGPCRKIRIVIAGLSAGAASCIILSLCGNTVSLISAQAKVIVLKIPCSFGKAKTIHLGLIAVHHIEHLDDRTALCLCGKRIVARSRIARRRVPCGGENAASGSGAVGVTHLNGVNAVCRIAVNAGLNKVTVSAV